MADELKIKVTADTKQAVDAVDELKEKLQETRDEAKNIFAKGLSESLPEQLQDVARGFGIASDKTASYTTRLQGGVGAMLIAKNAAVDLAGRAIDLARAFGEANAAVEQEQRALRALGDGYATIRAATSNTTSATDALTIRQTLLRNGFEANADTLARVARLGREYSQTWGGTATDAVNTFVQAVRSGDAEALQPFGVHVEQGKTSAQRMSQAVEQLADRFARVGPAARTAADEAAAFERGLTRMRNEGLTALNRMFLHIPEGIHAAVTALGEMLPAEAGVEDAADRAARNLERQTAATRATATATASLTEELSKADQQLKAFEETLREAPSYTQGANESFQDAVSRATQQAVNQMGRARATRRLQRAVRRSLGNTVTAQDLQDMGLPPDAARDYAAIFAARARRKRVDWQTLNGYSNEQMDARDQWEAGLSSTRSEMAAQVEIKRREQITFEAEQNAATRERDLSFARGVSTAGEQRFQGALDYERRQQRGVFGSAADQFADRFGASRSASEQTAALTQQTADTISSSFDQMTNGLNSFLDTLIESPEKAGEASVALAKGVLKGIALMAVQKSIFSLAEGFAALGSANPASASQFFIASGIYAGVAVAAGAGAAGIAAAQRGGAQATPPSTSSGFGPARADSGRGGGSRETPMYTININGSVLDQGGFEDAIVRGIRSANARGAGGR